MTNNNNNNRKTSTALDKVMKRKEKEFVMYTSSAVYMSVHMYPMILRKKVTASGIEYSATVIGGTRE